MEEAICQAYNKCFVASYEMDLDVTKYVFLINYIMVMFTNGLLS